jgi:hypothetical protein
VPTCCAGDGTSALGDSGTYPIISTMWAALSGWPLREESALFIAEFW